MDKKVLTHYSDYASQPDVKLLCGKWTTPSWQEKPKDLPSEVYVEEDGDRYTFSRKELVDCPECLGLLQHTVS